MNGKIIIPEWLKEASKDFAGFCEGINTTLEKRPNMTLAEYAEMVNNNIKRETLSRVEKAEEKQFGGCV